MVAILVPEPPGPVNGSHLDIFFWKLGQQSILKTGISLCYAFLAFWQPTITNRAISTASYRDDSVTTQSTNHEVMPTFYSEGINLMQINAGTSSNITLPAPLLHMSRRQLEMPHRSSPDLAHLSSAGGNS